MNEPTPTHQILMLALRASILVACLLSVALCLSWLTGCALVVTEASAPEVRQVSSALSVAATYDRAKRTAHVMGATVVREDTGHRFVATYKQVIALDVSVAQVPTGTQMTITGSILPQRVAVGTLTEVDDFVRLYLTQ